MLCPELPSSMTNSILYQHEKNYKIMRSPGNASQTFSIWHIKINSDTPPSSNPFSKCTHLSLSFQVLHKRKNEVGQSWRGAKETLWLQGDPRPPGSSARQWQLAAPAQPRKQLQAFLLRRSWLSRKWERMLEKNKPCIPWSTTWLWFSHSKILCLWVSYSSEFSKGNPKEFHILPIWELLKMLSIE